MIGDRILVVCTANMIRSPFIAGLLSSRLAKTGLVVDSAGTSARPGSPADERVAALGATYGLDLAAHRSQRLHDGMLRTGDTVLCAERAHCRVVLDLRPDLISSVFTIREFARSAEASRDRATTWPALVRASARGRSVAGRGPADEDDIVDPVGGPDPVWLEFERQATRAVSAILGAVSELPSVSPEPTPGRVPATRREYRGMAALPAVDRRSARRG